MESIEKKGLKREVSNDNPNETSQTPETGNNESNQTLETGNNESTQTPETGNNESTQTTEAGNNKSTQTLENNSEGGSSYPKSVRIAAIVCIVILIGLYILTLIAGITSSPSSNKLFKACVGTTIFLPIMLWVYIRLIKHLRGDSK